ncbi:MAG: hypothetical protein HUU35_17460 [Armatimonadetes bacterium]|nr:hypothetical protein [Armatimonadota bacterium]
MLASQPISRVALVGVAASAPQPPTIESLASSYFTLLTNPKLLGDNIQLQPAAQPQVNGDTVTLPFVGMNQAGPVAGFAIGKLGPAGNAIIVFTAGGQHEQQVVEALAREIVGSAAFGAPTEDPNQAFRALAGQRLVKTGGSYNKTSPNTSLSQDSQTVIDLGGNGQFAYHYRSMGMVTTPGGMGGHYDTNDNKRGTWRIEVYANGTGLLLVPDDGSEIMSFDIGVDGGQLLLNGAPYSRQPLG